jgi:eukaryotic-like serine/threonine-protein kinase
MAALKVNRIGECDVIRLIASGGFSDVFLATHSQHGQVAIKLHKPGWEDRAMMEEEIMQKIRHPAVVAVHGGGHDKRLGRRYTIMEYIPFSTLGDRLKQGKLFAPDLVVAILRRTAKTLDYVYGNSSVRAHRDIKPANIFAEVRDEKLVQLKISDFGIVRIKGGFRTTAAFGDPDYNAPEQIENNPQLYGAGTDIYSMGCLAHALLSGAPPYAGVSDLTTKLKAHGRMPPPDLSAVAGKPLNEVLVRCLARNPKDRFPSMRSFVMALDGVSGVRGDESLPGPAPIGGDAVPARSVSGEARSARPYWWAGCGAAGLFLALFTMGAAALTVWLFSEDVIWLWLGGISVGFAFLVLFLGGTLLLGIWLMRQHAAPAHMNRGGG